jgi:signal transduction histidine kinase
MEVELETRAKAQREQLRMICHDVEGPLRLALHALHQDQDVATSPGVARALSQLCRIDQMVSRARGVSRLRDGKMVVRREQINLFEEITGLMRDFEGLLRHKKLLVCMDVDAAMSAVADRLMLRDQILANVISNAVKFSPRGGVIRILGVRDASGFVGLKISDQGHGIPQAILADIFDPRSRSWRPGTDGEAGTGYGLPLVKAGVEAMGGVVELASTTVAEDPLNHGTTVTVWIPT